MKNPAIALALLALACLPAIPQAGGVHTFHLAPGRYVLITNDKYRILNFQSEYPINIVGKGCTSTSDLVWHCEFDKPSNVGLQDLNERPTFHHGSLNAVTLLAMRAVHD